MSSPDEEHLRELGLSEAQIADLNDVPPGNVPYDCDRSNPDLFKTIDTTPSLQGKLEGEQDE